MKIHPGNCHHGRGAPQKGVALVLTLLIISMLVVVVVGFVSVSRLEQMAARNYTYQAAAEQMAQLATGQALERLAAAIAKGADSESEIYATQPGMVHLSGGDTEPLFSQDGVTVNLNAATTNGFISGNAGDVINVGVLTVQAANNAPIGRTAFYIGDETVKLPVNHASAQRNHLNAVAPRPFSIRGLDTNLQAGAVTSFSNILTGSFSNNSISNWSYFFTPEQLAMAVTNIGPVRSRRATVASETNPNSQAPWGADKVRINDTNDLPLTTNSVNALAGGLTDSRLTDVFGGHFGDKYGAEGVRQLAANMLQLRSDHWAGGANFAGADPVLGSEQIAGGVIAPPVGPGKKTNGIPPDYLGYVPFPMLNEIEVSFVFGWTNAPPNDFLTIRVILTCVISNPFPVRYPGGGELYAQIDKASFLLAYNNSFSPNNWRGPDGSVNSAQAPHNDLGFDNPWGSAQQVAAWNLDPANGVVTTSIPVIAPNAAEEVSVFFEMSFNESDDTTRIDEAYLILDQIKLFAEAGNAESIRDWCSGNDFFNALSVNGATGPAQFGFTNIPPTLSLPSSGYNNRGPLPLTAPLPPTKLVRLDPRMKPGLAASAIYSPDPPGRAWAAVPSLAPSPGPADFLQDAIPADPAFPNNLAMAIYNTNLPPVLIGPGANYRMAADLGKVFTGMPWRTLRMQAQPVSEADAGMIPDWALLELIDFSDGDSAFTPVNPNVRYAASGGASIPGFGAGIRSQLSVLTDPNALGFLADPMNPGAEPVPNPGNLSAAGMNQAAINTVVNRIGQPESADSWAQPAGWLKRRGELDFPPGAMLLAGELAEIRGVADFAVDNQFKLNEYRLSALFPGVGTKSRFFKIYARGEAFEGTNSAAVAATAMLETLVEVDDSTRPPGITTIYQRLPAE